jgi:hypothetical protein
MLYLRELTNEEVVYCKCMNVRDCNKIFAKGRLFVGRWGWRGRNENLMIGSFFWFVYFIIWGRLVIMFGWFWVIEIIGSLRGK